MHYTLIVLIALSLSISHMGWLITSSTLLRPLRESVSVPLIREGLECSICTMTQLSLLLAWLVPDVIQCPAPLSYLLKAMLLAKLSCLIYDVGEALGSLSYWLQSSDHEDHVVANVPLVVNSAASIGDVEPQ